MSPGVLQRRTAAAGVLLAARTVYAFNWYDIGAVPVPIEQRFGIGTVDFGIILGAFLAGAAVFQIPAGLAAIRWGNRTTSLAALGVMGAFCLASGLAPSWTVLVLLRFGAGAGAAFFFAPALGLITSYFPPGSKGPVIGIYNAGFSLGSAVGLFGGAVIAQTYGYAATLAVGGVLLLGTLPVGVAFLPHEPPSDLAPAARRSVVRQALPILRSRNLWALALGVTGLWAGYYIAAQYFVEFAHATHPSWTLALAAAIPATMILMEIPGGPLGGWFGERSRDRRRTLLGWGLVSGALLAAVPFLPFAGLVPVFVALGFAAGVTFAVLYLIPAYLPEIQGAGFSLGLALVNAIQIFVGTALAVVFALLAAGPGFTVAWLYTGAVCVVFLPALLALTPVASPPRTRGGRITSDAARQDEGSGRSA